MTALQGSPNKLPGYYVERLLCMFTFGDVISDSRLSSQTTYSAKTSVLLRSNNIGAEQNTRYY